MKVAVIADAKRHAEGQSVGEAAVNAEAHADSSRHAKGTTVIVESTVADLWRKTVHSDGKSCSDCRCA
jgi:hypothetical protein